MTQREMMTELCAGLADKMDALFIGYNVNHGSMMYGTLTGCPAGSLIETPCAENLMAGMGIGIAISSNRIPVICFERHEFALFALGQIAVMADKLSSVTGVKVPMVVRVIKGAEKPLWPGEQHCTNYEEVLRKSCANSVFLKADKMITLDDVMQGLLKSVSGMVIILEDRDGYEQTV